MPPAHPPEPIGSIGRIWLTAMHDPMPKGGFPRIQTLVNLVRPVEVVEQEPQFGHRLFGQAGIGEQSAGFGNAGEHVPALVAQQKRLDQRAVGGWEEGHGTKTAS